MEDCKVCTKCGELKGLKNFYKDKRTKDGLRTKCIKCMSRDSKKYREENREKLVEISKKYRGENKEKIKKYREKNIEKGKEYSKKYQKSNREKLREYNKKYREENRERLIEVNKTYRNSPSRNESYIERLLISDEPQFLSGVVTVVCKKCKNIFPPTVSQIVKRIVSINRNDKGESNFYCSDECKNSCELYHFNTANQIDPRSILYVEKSDHERARGCQTEHLKQNQCSEKGHNYCESCGDIISVELHHTLEISKHGLDSINSSGHILLCSGCHVKLHSECK